MRRPSIKPPRYGWQNGVDSLLKAGQSFVECVKKQNADWVENKKWRQRYKHVNKFKHDPLKTFIFIQRQWIAERNECHEKETD